MHQPVYWLHDPWLALVHLALVHLALCVRGPGGGPVGCPGRSAQVVVTERVTPDCAVRDYPLSLFPEVESGPGGKCLLQVPKSRC